VTKKLKEQRFTTDKHRYTRTMRNYKLKKIFNREIREICKN